jgi:hypothetical protein
MVVAILIALKIFHLRIPAGYSNFILYALFFVLYFGFTQKKDNSQKPP